MSVDILMPALSPTMEEGTLSKWLVKEGDKVESGDLIAEIETDKATMEVEAIEDGIIGKILVSEGQESIKVNSKLFNLLSKARDEAHRFAIKANRHAKSKNINISILDSVYGVGPKIKQSLFNKFKSINVILDANEADLISVDGISKKIAKDIMKLKKK